MMKIVLLITVIFAILTLNDAKTKVKTKGCIQKCERKWVGYYQSCDSCEEYITCVWGLKYDRKCPDGLKWNDDTKGCDRKTPTCETI
ncbi:probable endochitinase [Mytilus edulis]|uniref:probable endochitinase n=1 Tax=Mytilus edulis TaxID=6550 RepID=UPI0039EF18E0